MGPIIGVPLRYEKMESGKAILYMFEFVRRAIQKMGGEVLVLTPVSDIDFIYTSGKDFPSLTSEDKIRINFWLDKCNGLFLPGGSKFTEYDRYILEYAIKNKIPVLGVCLSMQMMSCYNENVALDEIKTNIIHDQKDNDEYRHKIIIDKDSKLYSILGKTELMVNSYHKYCVTENHIYKTVALSEDGIIEAIEYPGETFNIGLQWHPERTIEDDDSKKIMRSFIEAAKNKKI